MNIGPSDQVFIGGKVVLIPNNPAEESQVISFRIVTDVLLSFDVPMIFELKLGRQNLKLSMMLKNVPCKILQKNISNNSEF